MLRAHPVLVLAILFAIGTTSGASAQVPSVRTESPGDAEFERARELFSAGLSHIEDARWADALEVFRECYELTGNSVALYNVALSLRALGRNVEAKAVFEALERRHDGDLPEDLRPAAAEMHREVTARIATLELLGIPTGAQPITVRVDGRGGVVSGPPFEVEADEGPRSVLVESESHGRFAWEGQLHPGQHLSLDVELEAESGGLPWWVFVGSGALVAVGVVILVVVLTSQESVQYDGTAEI
jgi:hypothetical protein